VQSVWHATAEGQPKGNRKGNSMSLTLYLHPLSSFCWKTLVALYENDTPFTPVTVDLSNETERAALL
jgi:hypothetical protein